MVFRRPYAFLIKHFRLIHIILFMLFAFITYKANNILVFFKDYITYNGSIDIVARDYFNFGIVISIIFVMAISIIIFFLMRYKKKPKLFYIITTVCAFISLILFIYLYGNIRELESITMAARSIRLLRDISRINYLMLFVICIPTIIRGLGFDIKKFDFSKDLHELQLEEADSEEVEINTEISTDRVFRFGRKIIRELKYYYSENKLFINIIVGVVVVILIMIFPFNRFVIHGTLNEGSVLSTDYFDFKVVDSFVSDRKRISKDNAYVIVKFAARGKINKYSLVLDEFVLRGKNNSYIPSLKYYYFFDDVGTGYGKSTLSTNDYTEYILVYNIKKEDKRHGFVIDYLGNDRKIRLAPSVLE